MVHFHNELKFILNSSDSSPCPPFQQTHHFLVSTNYPYISLVCFSVHQVKSSGTPPPLSFLCRKIYSLRTHLLLDWLACLKCRELQIKWCAFPFWRRGMTGRHFLRYLPHITDRPHSEASRCGSLLVWSLFLGGQDWKVASRDSAAEDARQPQGSHLLWGSG